MAVFNPSGPGASITSTGFEKTGFNTETLSIPSANTEVTLNIPSDTKEFRIAARNSSTLRIYDSSGGSSYYTIWPGAYYLESNLALSGTLQLYIQASKAGEILEIIRWT